MDIRQMLKFQSKRQVVLTVAAIPVPFKDAYHFGIIEVDEEWRMISFEEKPKRNPKTILGNSDYVLASMGNYIFERTPLVKELKMDAADKIKS